MGKLTTAVYAGRNFTGADFSNQEEDWLNLSGCVFTDCDFRGTKLVGPNLMLAGARFIVNSDKTHLLKGLAVEERNAIALARAITFGDPEADADTEWGFATRQMTPRAFLNMLGVVVVPNADPICSKPSPASATP